jgi:serine/threonine protein kinase
VPIETGTKLGQYEVLELVGEGAMGSVYRAYHAQLDRTGAVKVMHAISPDRDSIARFRHEAQAIARMRHPNILNVFDYGEYEGTPYMIVEFVPGGNLAGRMNNGPLPWGTVMRFLHGIASGLDYAHAQGIVHRDVKPANVLLEKDETLVLADFGLAKLLQGSSLQSLTGVTTGTPAYMAPEQVTGHEVGPAADRYSLATIAYEMLTGSIPFEGQGVIELLYAHVHSDPTRPSSLNPQLNEKVDAVIMRGLAKEPGKRWATCEQFVNALGTALGTKATAGIERTIAMAPAAVAAEDRTVAIASPPHEIDSLFAPPPLTVPPPVWGPAVAARRRRRLYEIVAGAVILILLLVIGGVCAVEALQPKMSIDPTIAVPGDTVDVIASRLPADQFGQIQLHSDETFYFAFQAGGQGDFRQGIVIPSAATTGMHVVNVCWAGSCPLQTQLRIVAPGTLPNSSPSFSASPSGSGTPGTTPTPGRSPRPGSSPSSNPTSGSTSSPSPKPKPSPKPSPRPTPRPSPTPTTNPCPTSASAASLNASPNTVLLAGGPITITGTNFTPNKSVTVAYYKGGSSTPYSTKTVAVGCSGSFSTTVTSPGGALRTDTVTATDTAGRSASATVRIVL